MKTYLPAAIGVFYWWLAGRMNWFADGTTLFDVIPLNQAFSHIFGGVVVALGTWTAIPIVNTIWNLPGVQGAVNLPGEIRRRLDAIDAKLSEIQQKLEK